MPGWRGNVRCCHGIGPCHMILQVCRARHDRRTSGAIRSVDRLAFTPRGFRDRAAGHYLTVPWFLGDHARSDPAVEVCDEEERSVSQDKPNILVIWGDDIGISNLSCYSDGLMGYRTPNIDRIADEGARFTDYYGEQSCTAGPRRVHHGPEPVSHGADQGRAAGRRSGVAATRTRRSPTALKRAGLHDRAVRQEPLRRS